MRLTLVLSVFFAVCFVLMYVKILLMMLQHMMTSSETNQIELSWFCLEIETYGGLRHESFHSSQPNLMLGHHCQGKAQ